MTPLQFRFAFNPNRLLGTVAAFQLVLGALLLSAKLPVQWGAPHHGYFWALLISIGVFCAGSFVHLRRLTPRAAALGRLDRLLVGVIALLDLPLAAPMGAFLSLTLLYLLWRTRNPST